MTALYQFCYRIPEEQFPVLLGDEGLVRLQPALLLVFMIVAVEGRGILEHLELGLSY